MNGLYYGPKVELLLSLSELNTVFPSRSLANRKKTMFLLSEYDHRFLYDDGFASFTIYHGCVIIIHVFVNNRKSRTRNADRRPDDDCISSLKTADVEDTEMNGGVKRSSLSASGQRSDTEFFKRGKPKID